MSSAPTLVIYTHPDCAYSAAAKDELDREHLSYQEIDIAPFNNALNPPELCLEFFDQDGTNIGRIDGRPVRSDQVTSLTVLSSFGPCPPLLTTHLPAANETNCSLNQPDRVGDSDFNSLPSGARLQVGNNQFAEAEGPLQKEFFEICGV